MPMKTTKQLAIGRVASGYHYLADESDPNCRHVVGVDWQSFVARTAVKQDLLYTLGSAISIFAPSRHNAVARLEHLNVHGEDPGALGTGSAIAATPTPSADASAVDQPEVAPDVEEVAADQIATKIGEEFSGHGFAHLVAELLPSRGHQPPCRPVPPMGHRGPAQRHRPRRHLPRRSRHSRTGRRRTHTYTCQVTRRSCKVHVGRV